MPRAALAPARTVPVLVTPEGDVISDTLAMAETLAERHPEAGLWPSDARARALARVLVAEMHSSYSALRSACPMNLEHTVSGFSVSAAVQADLICSSPPFEATGQVCTSGVYAKWQIENGRNPNSPSTIGKDAHYGNTPGNVGNVTGDTFWQAAREIVDQCFQILRPGGVAIWVCKDFVRKGQRVPFSADWLRLCEACGFESVEWIKASLVKRDEQPGLFGEAVVKTKSRKSFFRRLAEAKGSPAIDHEDVLIVRKPGAERERFPLFEQRQPRQLELLKVEE
jgi:hypothetical protein